MLKKAAAIALLVFCAFPALSQSAKPRLGILPFTGGTGGDGETIATLFSSQPSIISAFTVLPRTRVNALVEEQRFQMSGYTDSDTAVRLGKLLNADFVISGHIRRLGNRNLLITTLINVETFELLAGDYREYELIENVRALLPDISRIIINASRRDTAKLPKLAVPPFAINNQGGDARDAETLAQILAIEIVNTRKYAVLPRTTEILAALKELEFQMSGMTTEEGQKRLGGGSNAEFVLNPELRSLRDSNMFIAQIHHVQDGSVRASGYREYQTITDGIKLMAELAQLLTGNTYAAARLRNREKWQAVRATMFSRRHLWSAGVSVGTSFADPWLIGTVHGTVAPLRNSFLEFGGDFGFISGIEGAEYFAATPFAHYALFIPFEESGGWYLGGGGGYMFSEYRVDDLSSSKALWAVDFIIGCNIWDWLTISYTLRTNFTSTSNKISAGYVYRFK